MNDCCFMTGIVIKGSRLNHISFDKILTPRRDARTGGIEDVRCRIPVPIEMVKVGTVRVFSYDALGNLTVTDKPILVYPNSGETYDPDRKDWVASTNGGDEDFVSYVSKWCEAGASLVGGCCRTTPNTIRAISRALHRD